MSNSAALAEAQVTHPRRPRLVEGVHHRLDAVVVGAPQLRAAQPPVGAHVRHVLGGQTFGAGVDATVGAHQLRERGGLRVVLEGPFVAQGFVVAGHVQPVVDAAGLVALEVPPRLPVALGGRGQDPVEGDGGELPGAELGDGGVGGDRVEQRLVGDLGVPADAQVHPAERRCDLGGLEQHRFEAGVHEQVEGLLGGGGAAAGRALVGGVLDGDQGGGLAEQQVGAGGGDVGGQRDVQLAALEGVTRRGGAVEGARQQRQQPAPVAGVDDRLVVADGLRVHLGQGVGVAGPPGRPLAVGALHVGDVLGRPDGRRVGR
jgi:hypothetical protein